MIKQCRSSSWLLVCAASERPFPSFTEPLPRMAILAPDSDSIFLRVLPRGPISRPTVSSKEKYVSVCLSKILRQACK
ncbi:hypothetical protein BU16DRAFT_31983 [Lophium mytilinum]|uniref:Uncharacterized protein n=1 Tax=Lophium mytilinum TaxID=390894 RepID=A0A6A6REA2_9PEZI|nr:hypothetical protein BU16DRAFT_31983 [Lophium mytilinum]